MEQIVFSVPPICQFLTEESKVQTYVGCERDDQNSKVRQLYLSPRGKGGGVPSYEYRYVLSLINVVQKPLFWNDL